MLSLTACGPNTTAANAESVPPAQSTETTTLAAKTGSFSDVPPDADYAQAVEWCREQSLMAGVGAGRFAPQGTLTRAMVATVLYRAEGEPAVTGAPTFTDTGANAWYSNAVTWANENGIVKGYGNGLFGTNDPVSVEQLDVILGRYTGNGPEWTGDPARAHAATRAQVAVALYNALKDRGGVPAKETGKILVAYFSCTGNTRSVAETVQAVTGGALFEIVPAKAYTSADLNYNTDCRANAEQQDDHARPSIANDCVVEDMDAYDVVFLGYPIWWGIPPKIVRTFAESYDLSGKTVVPFCTSGGSGFSDEGLPELAPDANWLTGRRLNGASRADVEEWVAGLDLPKQEENTMKKLTLSFNGHTYSATLADNSSAQAFAQLLKSGPLTVSAHDYGSFEKVGDLGTSLPRNDEQITTSPGDIILYQGDQITVYYAQNSWSFTRLGRIDDPSGLQEALGDGDVEITFQLTDGEGNTGPFDLAAGQVTLNSGYVMPINGLGTYSLHGDECVNAVKAALKSGVRLFDTASAYRKEKEVGQAIREGMEELEEFLPQVTVTPALVQNEIHPYYQENDVIPFIQEKGIVVQGWYPLGGRGHTAELLGDETISAIADTHGVSSAQVILRWNLQKGVVLIPGSSNPGHIKENTELYHFELTEEEMAQINAMDRGEKHDWY